MVREESIHILALALKLHTWKRDFRKWNSRTFGYVRQKFALSYNLFAHKVLISNISS